MSLSIKWPLEIGPHGKLERHEDDNDGHVETLRQIIILSLLPGQSANPYYRHRRIGSKDWTFKAKFNLEGEIRSWVEEVFRRLEGRARLTTVRIDSEGARTFLHVRYMNIEFGVNDSFTVEI